MTSSAATTRGEICAASGSGGADLQPLVVPFFTPDEERRRASELQRYEILDTPREATFDRITRLAKFVGHTPIATITLIDDDRQWFKSAIGLEACETARDIAFCNYTVAQKATLVVPDAAADPRFSANPLVVGSPFIRFYVGVPLISPRGVTIGTLCVIDTKPRCMSAEQIVALEDLARIVVDELELRRLATDDSLTGALTRRAFIADAQREVLRATRGQTSLALALFDVDHFKSVNDTYGHCAGDKVLTELVAAVRQALRSVDVIGRLGGEEFAILMPQADVQSAAQALLRVKSAIASREVRCSDAKVSVTASFGVTVLHEAEGGLTGALARADAALYAAKKEGRNRVVVHEDRPDLSAGRKCYA